MHIVSRFLITLACCAGTLAGTAAAQNNNVSPCENQHESHGDRVRVCEVRSYTMPTPSELDIHPGANGGISVYGEQRGDVSVKAEVSAWADSEDEARTLLREVKVTAQGDSVRADGPNRHNVNWSVQFRVGAPPSTNVDLHAQNGGIHVEGMTGRTRFDTTNGGIDVVNCGGDVSGETTNGGVKVDLQGSQWEGKGLNVKTTNGGVHIVMPASYRAHLETSTVNGGLHIDMPLTITGRLRGSINTDLNGGGPIIHAETVNGGVSIGQP